MVNRCLIIMVVFIGFGNAQSVPYQLPYSEINSHIDYLTSEISIKNLNSLNFFDSSLATILPDGIIYRLSIKFDSLNSGHVVINNWHVPDGAMLFVFNGLDSYAGPYLSLNHEEIISARFVSNEITLEYFEPINAEFSGFFNVDKILENYVQHKTDDFDFKLYKINSTKERPKIMVTGYWPPTNEMVRHFSQNNELNPSGWKGENWENSGYDIVSFFPQFDPPNCNNCGQGYGDLEVDYQDFSQDFWTIVNSIRPVGIITFSRGYNDMSWELENRVVNRTNWYDDYTAPFIPTPNPPDDSVNNYHVRYNSLPILQIISDIQRADLGLDPYLDDTNAGMFLSEFAGYHGVWYKELHDNDNDFPCYAGGHIHVGAQVNWDIAKEATEISIRALIDHISSFMMISGDCNGDGDVNILDIISLTNVILGFDEFSISEEMSADMDQNGQLDILDIISIVNLILRA